MTSEKTNQKISKGDKIYQSDLDTIAESAEAGSNPEIKAWLNAYSAISLPYCTPSNKAQDRQNTKQRLDDMVGGFPFTSELFPWPKEEKSGRDMQPIFQINLKNASEILQFDFGTGVLQVWGIAPSLKPLLLRIIPEDRLSDTVSNYFPEKAYWEQVPTREDSSSDVRTYMLDLPENILKKPRVTWKYAGRMFQASNDYMPVDLTLDEDFDDAHEYIQDVKESLTIAHRGNYLGGFGGCLGSGYNFLVSDPHKSRLLIRLTDELDCSVGVVAYRNADNSLRFMAEYNYLV